MKRERRPDIAPPHEETIMETTATRTATGQGLTVAGALMIEHRVIERMIRILSRETAAAENTGTLTVGLLDAAADFFRMYADRRHHGKEENIFFFELNRKDLTPEHTAMLRELIKDHITARELVTTLVSLNDLYKSTGPTALLRVIAAAQNLCKFYRAHIEKEDRQFFIPAMSYFTEREQAGMLEQFRKFDSGIPGGDYRSILDRFNKR